MAVRNLNVELHGASGLEDSEFIGKSDPYAIISIGKTERTSKVAHDQATAPSWNEKFTLPVLETDTELVIRILNENSMAKDDELGRVVIPLSEIHGSHDSASMLALQHKGQPHGEIKLNVFFEGEDSHESKGLIAKIQDLFMGEKEHHEEGDKELHEEKEHHGEDRDLKEKEEEKIEEPKEKVEEKADMVKEVGEEKAEKKKKEKKNKKDKPEKSGDKESSSSSDSESESEKDE